MTTVSVIIPFYGRHDWVYEAVHSVLMQSFADYEIILVDDGSPEEFPLALATSDARVRLLRKENRGPASARNLGIAHASGTYIAFLDSDDRFEPEKLQVQVAAMEARPDVLLSHTSYYPFGAELEAGEVLHSGRFTGQVYPGIIYLCPIATPTVMVRREALAELAFEESVRVGEDIILWSRIAARSEILGIDCPLTGVRMHGANAAADPRLQLSANLDVLRHAMQVDRALGLGFWRLARGTLHVGSGHLALARGEQARALAHHAIAALLHSSHRRTFFHTALVAVGLPADRILGLLGPIRGRISRLCYLIVHPSELGFVLYRRLPEGMKDWYRKGIKARQGPPKP